MAKQGIEVAEQDERYTDQSVVYDVRRIYYSAILSKRLVQIARDTLERMEATLDLTKRLYQTGSGTVKKTDYLRNNSMVATIRSMVAELESTEKTVFATLVAVIGLDWEQAIELMDEEIPFIPTESNPSILVHRALSNNPQIAKLQAAIKAAEAGIVKARSGYIPKVGFFGSANKIWNSYDAGIVTPENKFAWAVGIGVEIPIFKGFRVNAELREARAQLQKNQRQLALLQDALALEVKQTCFDVQKTIKQHESTYDAMISASENRDLNIRAYQEELVETQDVIEAQILEALLSGQHQRVLYDHINAQAKLDFVMGINAEELAGRY
jgi:outer membrane protein TolC